MRRDGIAILHLQCPPEGITTYSLATIRDRRNIGIVCRDQLEESLTLGLTALRSGIFERCKQEAHVQRVVSIREVNGSISEVQAILVVVVADTLHLDDLSISDKVRSVGALGVMVVVASDDEPFTSHHRLFLIEEDGATNGMVTLQGELI